MRKVVRAELHSDQSLAYDESEGGNALHPDPSSAASAAIGRGSERDLLRPLAAVFSAEGYSPAELARLCAPIATIERDGGIALEPAEPAAVIAAALRVRRLVGGSPAGRLRGAVSAGGQLRAAELASLAGPGQLLTDIDAPAAATAGYGVRALPSSENGDGPRLLCWARPPRVEITTPFPDRARLACRGPIGLVGREREMRAIEAAWRGVLDASQGLALIEGEPGIGKTRLAAEAAAEMHRAGATVLWGRCREDLDVPFLPLSGALGSLLNECDEETVAQLRRVAPTLAGTWSMPGEADADPDPSTRLALFDEAAAVFEQLSAQAPLVIVVEDAHAIDSASLDLLRFFGVSPRSIRAMLIATYRPEAVAERGRLAAAVAEIRSDPATVSLQLAGLDDSESLLLAHAYAGSSGPALLGHEHELNALTGGNPLFVSELGRDLGERGDGVEPLRSLPRNARVAEAVNDRLKRLPPECRTVLEAASVVGREFRSDLLAPIAALEADAVAAALEAAEASGVIVALPRTGHYEFDHALSWQAFYETQSSERRGRRHRLLAELLEQRASGRSPLTPGLAVELAHHYSHALPPDDQRAMHWSERAGLLALGSFDAATAERLLAAALELCREGAGDAADECRLTIGLGSARRHLGEPGGHRLMLDAAALAYRLGDTDQMVRALLVNRRGLPSTVAGVDEEMVSALRRAERALAERDGPGDRISRARVLASLGVEITFSPDVEERLRVCEEAVRLAEAAGDDLALARTLADCMHSTIDPATLADRRRRLDEAISLASGHQDLFLQMRLAHLRAQVRIEAADLAGARDELERERAIAERLGDPTADWVLSVLSAGIALAEGDAARAEAAADGAAAAASGVQPDAVFFHANQLMVVRFLQGRMGELAPLLEGVVPTAPGLPGFRAALAVALIEAQRPREAEKLLVDEAADEFAALVRDSNWLLSNALWGHVAAELGSAPAAEILLPKLEPFEAQLAHNSVGGWGLVGHITARLQLLLDRDRGIERLRWACERSGEIGLGAWTALAMAHLAQALSERAGAGDRVEAAGLAAEAEREAEACAAPGVAARARAMLIGAEAPGIDPRAVERARRAGLSGRELEVLAAIGAGRTNAQIAVELGIVPGTVKRHLERIYDKLGVRTRAGAVGRIIGTAEPSGFGADPGNTRPVN